MGAVKSSVLYTKNEDGTFSPFLALNGKDGTKFLATEELLTDGQTFTSSEPFQVGDYVIAGDLHLYQIQDGNVLKLVGSMKVLPNEFIDDKTLSREKAFSNYKIDVMYHYLLEKLELLEAN